jgi:phospholipase A1
MRYLFIFVTILVTITFANTELEAMILYKRIALHKNGNDLNNKEKNSEIKTISKKINSIGDTTTAKTIDQIITSSFDIYPHHENYFLPITYDTKKREGRDQNEAKFQFSIKKPIATNLFGFDEIINFGYTQSSWWQIYEESSPFRETNYKPEIFVTVPYGKKDKTSLKGFRFGFLHESNGQSDETSRSWNRLYLAGYFQVGNLFIIPKLWHRIKEKTNDDDNPELVDYMGYGDIKFIYPYKEHVFKLLLRDNLKLNDDNKGFAEFNWTFPFFGAKNTFGYLQLSTGYGDSLIDYNREINRIGFGISLSR